MKIPRKVCRKAILLFQDQKHLFVNSCMRETHGQSCKNNLMWTKSETELTNKYNFQQNDKNEFTIQEDWSKVIHVFDNKFFVTGGSWQDDSLQIPIHMRAHKYSKKTFMIDIETGVVERLADMATPR